MGGIDFKDGYVSAGQFEYLLDAVKWGADYYLKVFYEFNFFYLHSFIVSLYFSEVSYR